MPVLDPDYTAPDKFLIGQVFYLYPTRLQGTVQILLQYCLNESVPTFASLSTGMALFLSKARNYAPGLCKNLHGSGVVKEEPHQSKILTYFWSDQILTVKRASFQRVAPLVLLLEILIQIF